MGPLFEVLDPTFDLLIKFFCSCPEAIKEVTTEVPTENSLHLTDILDAIFFAQNVF